MQSTGTPDMEKKQCYLVEAVKVDESDEYRKMLESVIVYNIV